MTAVALGMACLLLFVLSAVFLDPRVVGDGGSVDFAALTTAFFTLNMMPNIAVGFMADKRYLAQAKKFGATVAMAARAASDKRKAAGDDESVAWLDEVRSSLESTETRSKKKKSKKAKKAKKKKKKSTGGRSSSNSSKQQQQQLEEEEKNKNKNKPFEFCGCCKRGAASVVALVRSVLAWAEARRSLTCHALWFLTGWLCGGQFLYLRMFHAAALRLLGFLLVLIVGGWSEGGLMTFALLPVIATVWISDWLR